MTLQASELLQFKDNGLTTTTSTINNTDDPVTFTVADGAQLGSAPAALVLDGAGTREVVKMISRSTNTVIAARLREPSATKLAHASGVTVEPVAAAFALRAISDTLGRKEYDVLNYGAVADGVTDCATVVGDLVTLLYSQGGGTIYFPRGTYACSGVMLPVNMAGVVFRGESAEGTIIKHTGTGKLFNLSYLNRGGLRDMQLRAGSATTDLIHLSGSSNCQLQRLKLQGFTNSYATMTSGSAVLVSDSDIFTAADATNHRRVIVVGAGAAGAPLITTISAYTNAHQVTLATNAGTSVTGTSDYPILWRPTGIKLYGSPSANPDYPGFIFGGTYFNTIEDCRLESMDVGIDIESTSGRKVAMNHFRQVSVTSATNQGAGVGFSLSQSTSNLFTACDVEQCEVGLAYNNNCLDDAWVGCWNQGAVTEVNFITSDNQFVVIGGQWADPGVYSINSQILWATQGILAVGGKAVPNLGNITSAKSFTRTANNASATTNNPLSVGDGTFAASTFNNCTGVQVTNPVTVATSPAWPAGTWVDAVVTTANTIRVTYHNESGGSVDFSGAAALASLSIQMHVLTT